MFRASIFEEVGLYNENMFAEDYFMILKISSKYCVGFLDEYLGFYRYNDTIIKIERFDRVADSHLMAIEEYKDHPLYKKAKAMVYLRKFDTFAGFKTQKVKAIKNLFKALYLFNNKRFWVGFIKLVIYWKN
jgi:hypothetical protein